MKKRLALGSLIVFGLVLVLIHTQPIERLIFRNVQSRLAALGWKLEAKRFDLNLFALSVKLKDLELDGPGTDAHLQHLYANANSGILFGNIDIGEIDAGQGVVNVMPQPASGKASGAPFSLPPIRLDHVRLEKILVSFEDTQRELDVTFKDLGLAYDGQTLKANIAIPEFAASGRTIPRIDARLSLETTQFQSFRNIQLNLGSRASHFDVTGQVNEDLEPTMTIKAEIGADLLPELPGTVLVGSIDQSDVKLHLENTFQIHQSSHPWSLDSEFNYRQQPIKAPVRIHAENLLDGTILLVLEDELLRGDVHLQGHPQGISELDPNLDLAIENAHFEGEFQLPQLDPKRLSAEGRLEVTGTPFASLELTYRDQVLQFNGEARPVPEASLTLEGEMGERLQSRFSAKAPSLAFLKPFMELPPQLSSGPIQAKGAFSSDFKNHQLNGVQLDIAALTYGETFEGPVRFQLDGPLEHLRGRLFSTQLRPSGPAITFDLDVIGQQWHQLDIAFLSQPLHYDAYATEVKIDASGSGPLLAPEMSGNIDADFTEGAVPVGRLFAGFNFKNDTLDIPKIEAVTHHGRLEGNLKYDLDSNHWQTDLLVKSAANPEWTPITDLEIPKFEFLVTGNQDDLEGRLSLKDQTVQYGDWQLPFKADQDLRVSGNATEQVAKGHLPTLDIAGIQIRDFQFGIENQQLHLDGKFSLTDITTIQNLLGEQWPAGLNVTSLSGQIQANSDLKFQAPEVALTLNALQGSYREEPIHLDTLHLDWTPERLQLDPAEMVFAGTRLKLATTAKTDAANSGNELPLDLTLAFEAEDTGGMANLLKEQWPQELSLEAARGQVRLRSDWTFQNPALDFAIADLNAEYNGQSISTQNLTGVYDKGLSLSPGLVQFGDLTIQIEKRSEGVAVTAQPDMAFLAQWLPGAVGDAEFDVNIIWNPEGQGLQARIKQLSGRLIYPEPWLEVVDLDLLVSEEAPFVYKLEEGSALVNRQPLTYSGSLDMTGAEPDLLLLCEVSDLPLSFADYQFTVSSVVEWRLNQKTNLLTGTVSLKDGYLSPQLEVEGLVQELLSPVPAIYFPDPLLEEIKLQVIVLTETPVVVEHPLGYWELETPSLIVGGNLASPMPQSGTLNINEGSVLRQGRNTFLFQNSQIQFHPNHLGDPYLQIAMVEAGYAEDKQPIYFTGYISEFDQNLGSQNITSFFLQFILGRVTSLVSFEIQINDTIADSSFTTWISRRLTDKAVVRYAVPLNDQEQRLEVKFGPFWRNFINFAEENNDYSSTLRHAQRLGFLTKPPERVKKVTFQGTKLPSGLQRKFKLERGDAYSETRLRYAVFDLRRRLKMRGYLLPKITTNYQDRVVTVKLDQGPKFDLVVEGLKLEEKEKQNLFLQMQGGTESGARHLELLAERLALSKGHPSAAAFADIEGQTIKLNIYVGHPIGKMTLNFGKAQPLLSPLYTSAEETRRFIIKYFVSSSDAEAELRARLAAKGYVRPTIEPAEFPKPEKCVIAIDPGPRASLFLLVVNGEPTESPLVGKPFEYSFMSEVTKTLSTGKDGSQYQVRLQARREDENIFFDVIRTPVKDNDIESLTVTGTGRISEEKIKSFLGFEKNMPQSKLVKNQEQLIETGSFNLARLRTTENEAFLEVRERNRWDIDYELSYDEVNELGVGIQFRDRMLFKGFNPMGFAVRRNRVEEEVIGRQQFLHIFGSPLDFFVGFRWNNERLDLNPDQSEPLFGTVFVTSRPRETQEINTGLSFKFREHQLITAGVLWENIITRQYEEVFFLDENDELVPDPTVPPARLADLKVTRIPLRASWLFSNLDNELYPNRGIYSQFSYDYFPRELGTNAVFSGWRALGKFNTFFTKGRWRWWQRLEAGLYERELRTDSILEDDADNNLFFLGGPKSIRGFGYQMAGPARLGADDTLIPQGGQAMAIFTQEINFDLNLYGFGISPFVDGGWVWRDRQDFLKDGLAISGGLGLTLETPIGRFRFDWATPIDDRPLDRMLDQLFGNDSMAKEMARDRILNEFSIRFGRVF